MKYVFIAQLVIGLIVYGRGWWHGAFAPGEDNKKQLYVQLRGFDVNLTATGNVTLGLALIIVAIIGLGVL